MYGASDTITIFGSHFDSVSGRSPVIKYQSHIHMLSNLWSNNGAYGTSISVEDSNSACLAEGNVFNNDPKPVDPAEIKSAAIYAHTSNTQDCQAVLKRDCLANGFVDGSQAFDANAVGILGEFSKEPYVEPIPLDQVEGYVKGHAGFGKIWIDLCDVWEPVSQDCLY